MIVTFTHIIANELEVSEPNFKAYGSETYSRADWPKVHHSMLRNLRAMLSPTNIVILLRELL